MSSIVTPGGLYVDSAWSKAGIGTTIRIRGRSKKIDILFDCGTFDESLISSSYVLITHGHTDHLGSCISHARARALQRSPANYYVPTDLIGALENARIAFSVLNGKDIPMNIIPVSPGDVFYCENIKVLVFPTQHRVRSQGYALFTTDTRSLKEEYAQLENNELRKLVEEGICIKELSEVLDIVYTGDTTFLPLLDDATRFIFNTTILILELTYLDGDVSKAIEYGHIHLNDIVSNQFVFTKVYQIIFVHISTRYSPYSRIIDLLRKSLPREILSKSIVALKSFNAPDMFTNPNERNLNEVGWGWGEFTAVQSIK